MQVRKWHTLQDQARKRLHERRNRPTERLRLNLREFIEGCWKLVEPADLVWEPHMDLLTAHLTAIASGECRRLIVNQPPGTSKSLFFNVFFPAWVWTFAPGKKFMFATYSQTNAYRDASKFSTIVESDWYTTKWGKYAGSKMWGLSYLANRHNGFRSAVTIGGKALGQHADVQVCDDPIKPRDASGTTAKNRVKTKEVLEWWTKTMPSRMNDQKTGARIIVMQRLSDDDLAGEMIASGDYHHLCMPMRYNPAKHTSTPWGQDWRTAPGELLCPSRYPKDEVERLARELGPYDEAAQLEQDPVPEGGTIFERHWLDLKYQTIPRDAVWIASWDASFKGGEESSHVACAILAQSKGYFYVVHISTASLTFTETIEAMLSTAKQFPRITGHIIEDKANGPAIYNTLTTGKHRVSGMIAAEPTGDKMAWPKQSRPILRPGMFSIRR